MNTSMNTAEVHFLSPTFRERARLVLSALLVVVCFAGGWWLVN